MKLRQMFWGVLLISFFPTACGQYSDSKIKNYALHFYSSESTLLQASQRLVVQYNRMASLPVLTYAGSENDANSYVQFVQGLDSKDGKIGYGQWVTETSEEPFTRSLEGHVLQREITYSMNIEFDYNYYKARATAADNSLEWKTLFVLFCHEVGHGLTMDDIYDETQKSQIMYGVIDDKDIPNKDFTTYFGRVRSFFADK